MYFSSVTYNSICFGYTCFKPVFHFMKLKSQVNKVILKNCKQLIQGCWSLGKIPDYFPGVDIIFNYFYKSENLSEDFYAVPQSTCFQRCKVCHAHVVHEDCVTAFEKPKTARKRRPCIDCAEEVSSKCSSFSISTLGFCNI